jgi:hypothetical protein
MNQGSIEFNANQGGAPPDPGATLTASNGITIEADVIKLGNALDAPAPAAFTSEREINLAAYSLTFKVADTGSIKIAHPDALGNLILGAAGPLHPTFANAAFVSSVTALYLEAQNYGMYFKSVGVQAMFLNGYGNLVIGDLYDDPGNGERLQVQGNIMVNHIQGATPNVTWLQGTGAGDEAFVDVVGNDMCGEIYFEVAGTVTAFGVIVTITLNNPYRTDFFYPIISGADFASNMLLAAGRVQVERMPGGQFRLSAGGAALVPTNTYNFYYHILGG